MRDDATDTQIETDALKPIHLQGVTLAEVENMEIGALREALSAVLRHSENVADHQNHQSHANSFSNVTSGD